MQSFVRVVLSLYLSALVMDVARWPHREGSRSQATPMRYALALHPVLFSASCPAGCRDVDRNWSCGGTTATVDCVMSSAGDVTMRCRSGYVYRLDSLRGCSTSFVLPPSDNRTSPFNRFGMLQATNMDAVISKLFLADLIAPSRSSAQPVLPWREIAAAILALTSLLLAIFGLQHFWMLRIVGGFIAGAFVIALIVSCMMLQVDAWPWYVTIGVLMGAGGVAATCALFLPPVNALCLGTATGYLSVLLWCRVLRAGTAAQDLTIDQGGVLVATLVSMIGGTITMLIRPLYVTLLFHLLVGMLLFLSAAITLTAVPQGCRSLSELRGCMPGDVVTLAGCYLIVHVLMTVRQWEDLVAEFGSAAAVHIAVGARAVRSRDWF